MYQNDNTPNKELITWTLKYNDDDDRFFHFLCIMPFEEWNNLNHPKYKMIKPLSLRLWVDRQNYMHGQKVIKLYFFLHTLKDKKT